MRSQNLGLKVLENFFNYRTHLLEPSWWELRNFMAAWWRIYHRDPYWVPPYYPDLLWELQPTQNHHLARMSPILVYTEARPRPGPSSVPVILLSREMPVGGLNEVPLAAAVILRDKRRADQSGYLALLHCSNDLSALEHLLATLSVELNRAQVDRLIGPTGLSPHLNSGLPQNNWSRLPEMHTPYGPPYLPELFAALLSPVAESRLYQLAVSRGYQAVLPAGMQLIPVTDWRGTPDLVPLFQSAVGEWPGFPLPDRLETDFLIRWIKRWPLHGWLAVINHKPVGVIVAQPDLAAVLLRAGGGRTWVQRIRLRLPGKRPAERGQILFLGVLPEWRRKGIGTRLVSQVARLGQSLGWQTISIGPAPDPSPALGFLAKIGAEPQQSYLMYEWLIGR